MVSMGNIVNFLACFFSLLFIGSSMNAEEIIPEDYEVYVDEIVRAYSQKIENELDLICIGDGGRMPKDVESISVKFVAYRRATIEEARALEVKATEALLSAINNHEKIRPFLREHPFKANRAEVSISFNKPDNSSYLDGSVVYVMQVKNKIHYFSDDGKSKRYNLLKAEPFEEAVKNIESTK
jgi:hypothetical protein